MKATCGYVGHGELCTLLTDHEGEHERRPDTNAQVIIREAERQMAEQIKALHDGFGPSNPAEDDYNAGAHEAIGRALDLFRISQAVGTGDE